MGVLAAMVDAAAAKKARRTAFEDKKAAEEVESRAAAAVVRKRRSAPRPKAQGVVKAIPDRENAPEVEQWRRKCGLSRSTAYDLVGGLCEKNGIDMVDGEGHLIGRAKMFGIWNGSVPVPAWFTDCMATIVTVYEQWKADILERMGTEGEVPGKLTTRELARLLDMTDYYIFELRWDGALTAGVAERRAVSYVYSTKDVEGLFRVCENWIKHGHPDKPVLKESHNVLAGKGSPLGRPFARHCRRLWHIQPAGGKLFKPEPKVGVADVLGGLE